MKILEGQPDLRYQDIANEYKISKARVCQMIALVKKLPSQIIEYFTIKEQAANLDYFTERRLRPLTLLESDKEKIERFTKMVEGVTHKKVECD